MNQEVAPRTNFAADLDAYEPQIAAALPAHINVERFKRIVTTAINRTPDLYLKADRRSLFNACVQCASDGLVPDGREAALVIYGNKAQYLPMVGGVIKRMRNSGDVASVDAQVIHEHDHFEYALGDDARIVHKPTLGEPGKVIGAYAIIKLMNGEVLREVMSVAQIEKVRAVSRSSKNGPWVQWFDEMARKTVLRRCAKRAPTSPDLERIMYRGDTDDGPTAPPPSRPTREQFQSSAPDLEPEQQDAAAGHADLDAQYRETMAHDADGVVADAPPPSPEAMPDVYDAPAEYESLLAGAMAETTADMLREYWKTNKAVIGRLPQDLRDELAAKVKVFGKELEAKA